MLGFVFCSIRQYQHKEFSMRSKQEGWQREGGADTRVGREGLIFMGMGKRWHDTGGEVGLIPKGGIDICELML